jgi:transposase InsO family protein
MSTNQARFRVATMARVLGVSTSGYYAWRQRPPSARAQADAELTARVQEIHAGSRGTYGAPRIHAELVEAGAAVGHKRVARVMREAGIAGVSRRRGPRTTRRDVRARPAPDRVERRFEADKPNRLWVADITYVPTLAGFLYLAIVLDVFSRRVVGWSMASHLRTELVIEALEMAIEQRRPEAVVHHSDQGCQYTSLAFGARCREWDVALSMGSVGDCFDNAMAESFFATLECELLARTSLSTHAEARAAVFDFVEGWYNTRRRHSALGYVSPLEFERLHAAEPVDGARPVEALQAPTSQVELGLPVTTHAVTGVAVGA